MTIEHREQPDIIVAGRKFREALAPLIAQIGLRHAMSLLIRDAVLCAAALDGAEGGRKIIAELADAYFDRLDPADLEAMKQIAAGTGPGSPIAVVPEEAQLSPKEAARLAMEAVRALRSS